MKYLQFKFEDKEIEPLDKWAKDQGSNLTVEVRRLIINKIREVENE